MAFIRTVGVEASLDRLEALIRRRLEPGADQDAIDQRIWELFGETRAIVFTDLSGFSRQVAEFGIIHFLQVIFEAERLLIPLIEDHGGILMKVEGDSMLIIFRSAAQAVRCSIAMQQTTQVYNVDRAATEQVLLCVGVGYGRVLRIGDSDVFGAEVNAASKLGEDTARSGEILVTESVRRELEKVAVADLQSLEAIAEIPPGAEGAHRLVYTPGINP